MFLGDIGTKATTCIELVPIHVGAGQTVTVKNTGTTTITYVNSTLSTTDGTIAAAASQAFTLPAWMYAGTAQAGGRTSVQITGGDY